MTVPTKVNVVGNDEETVSVTTPTVLLFNEEFKG